MPRIQFKKYVKNYSFHSNHIKRRHPNASYFVYIPKPISEKCLDKYLEVKLEGEEIMLEPEEGEKA